MAGSPSFKPTRVSVADDPLVDDQSLSRHLGLQRYQSDEADDRFLQTWLLDLCLVGLGSTILFLLLNYFRFDDPRPLHNAWTYIVAVPAGMVLLSMAMRWFSGERLRKSIQLSFLLSVLVHLILTIMAINIFLFAKYWPDVFAEISEAPSPQRTVPEYFQTSATENGARPDYLRPVETDVKATESVAEKRQQEVTIPRDLMEIPEEQPKISKQQPFRKPLPQPQPSQPSISSQAMRIDRTQPDVALGAAQRRIELPDLSPDASSLAAKPKEFSPRQEKLNRASTSNETRPRRARQRTPELAPSDFNRGGAISDLAARSEIEPQSPTIKSQARSDLERTQTQVDESFAASPIEIPQIESRPSAMRSDLQPTDRSLAQQPDRRASRSMRSPTLQSPSSNLVESRLSQPNSSIVRTPSPTQTNQPQIAAGASARREPSRSITNDSNWIASSIEIPSLSADTNSSNAQASFLEMGLVNRDLEIARNSSSSNRSNMDSSLREFSESTMGVGSLPPAIANGTQVSNAESATRPEVGQATIGRPFASSNLSAGDTGGPLATAVPSLENNEGQSSGREQANSSFAPRVESTTISRSSSSGGAFGDLRNQSQSDWEGSQADMNSALLQRSGLANATTTGSTDGEFENALASSMENKTVDRDQSASGSVSGRLPDGNQSPNSSLSQVDKWMQQDSSGQSSLAGPVAPSAPTGKSGDDGPEADDMADFANLAGRSELRPARTQPDHNSKGMRNRRDGNQRSELAGPLDAGQIGSALNRDLTKLGLDPMRREIAMPEIRLADLQTQRFQRSEVGGPDIAALSIPTPAPAFQQRIDRTQSGAESSNAGAFGPETERAIELGLAFLAKTQRDDGAWHLGQFDTEVQIESHAAATALALLSFQGAGYTHRQFKYSSNVDAALEFLIDHQKRNGDLYIPMGEASDANAWLYSHAIASLALCEAYGMTQDQRLREPAQRAVDFMVASQDQRLGGWRYTPGTGSDTSVTGWFMMALKSAQLAGLDVPNEAFAGVSRWVKNSAASAREPYLFRYNYEALDTPQQRHGRVPTPVMTSVGLLMKLYLGWERTDQRMQAGVDHLLESPPSIGSVAQPNRDTYYWYYGTQVLFHVGGEQWEKWNQRLYPILINSQISDGTYKGSWNPLGEVPDAWGKFGGRLYVTTLNLLSLEVNYRHLPLYESTASDFSPTRDPDANPQQ